MRNTEEETHNRYDYYYIYSNNICEAVDSAVNDNISSASFGLEERDRGVDLGVICMYYQHLLICNKAIISKCPRLMLSKEYECITKK